MQQLPEFKISLENKIKPSELPVVNNSKEVVEVCRAAFSEGKIEWIEEVVVIGLSMANRVIGFYRVSSGGITGTVADPRVILQFLLLCNATNFIISHNHPSGNLKPSKADELLTQKIKTAAAYMDLKMVDHIIITADAYYSFADEGIL